MTKSYQYDQELTIDMENDHRISEGEIFMSLFIQFISNELYLVQTN